MWIAGSVASATTVYKWVDENGITHYSDQPHENADKVEVRKPQTYTSQRGTPSAADDSQSPPPTSVRDQSYEMCSLTQPTAEQTLPNAYSATVAVQSAPALRPGDRVVVRLDGKPVSVAPGATSVTIPTIERGQHSVDAAIQNPAGQTVCQTPSVTFYVTQPSLLSPNRPRH